jgi:hypothetical protein
MTYENYIKARLVEFAVNEAYHHGGVESMCAVAQVLANRVNAGWGEWKEVLDKATDYSGTIVDPPTIDPRDATFRRMLTLVDDIYHGIADDSNVNIEDDRGKLTALYYADLNDLGRNWFRENVLNDLKTHPRIASVGPLTFFA